MAVTLAVSQLICHTLWHLTDAATKAHHDPHTIPPDISPAYPTPLHELSPLPDSPPSAPQPTPANSYPILHPLMTDPPQATPPYPPQAQALQHNTRQTQADTTFLPHLTPPNARADLTRSLHKETLTRDFCTNLDLCTFPGYTIQLIDPSPPLPSHFPPQQQQALNHVYLPTSYHTDLSTFTWSHN